jgi:hypothetical protein
MSLRLHDHLPWEPKRMFWVCPECEAINAWNWMMPNGLKRN